MHDATVEAMSGEQAILRDVFVREIGIPLWQPSRSVAT